MKETEVKITDFNQKLSHLEQDFNDNISVMKGSSTSSEVNSSTTPFAGKRIFIKGISADGSGTGGGASLNSKA
jgi:hypothetical protein